MSISYKPLPPSCTIKQSDIHGLGLFATVFIPKSYNLGITHIKNNDFEDGYIRTPLGGFFNHSTNPNCKVVDDGRHLNLVTIVGIHPGEEITAFYTLYTPENGEK